MSSRKYGLRVSNVDYEYGRVTNFYGHNEGGKKFTFKQTNKWIVFKETPI